MHYPCVRFELITISILATRYSYTHDRGLDQTATSEGSSLGDPLLNQGLDGLDGDDVSLRAI